MGRNRYNAPRAIRPTRTNLPNNLAKVSLIEYRDGPGNAGSRWFHKQDVPLLREWNPKISFDHKRIYSVGQSFAVLTMRDGTQKNINLANKRQEEIMSQIEQQAKEIQVDPKFVAYLEQHNQALN
eukprot:gb/GECH01012701.1/.p1 GENE.gb/GECH01012701.1/~~gb/GECH01012701.1/.p1  ORF type:complete len:125 (+),score=28.25 gb/GECH01012701.1/:1-375(+)